MNLSVLILATLGASLSLPEDTSDKNSIVGKQPKDPNINPDLLQEAYKASKDIESSQSKGFDYYLVNYGPLAKVLVDDFMDSFGLAKNLQLAIPVIAKMVLIIMYAGMQFKPSLLEFQQTTRTAYLFLQNFNEPEVKVMNDITDRVFEVLEKELVRR